MLSGFTHMTYSLVVIMLETTQQINFFIPVTLTVLVAQAVGKAFNRSLYEKALRGKQIPLLRNNVPKTQRDVTAYQIMSPLVLTCEGIVSVDYLTSILQKPFSQYPVLNSKGNIVGMIPKNFLIVIVENHHWMNLGRLNDLQKTKLSKMYASVAMAQVRDTKKFARATTRRFATGKGIIGPQDWYT